MKKILKSIVHRITSDSLKRRAAGVERTKAYQTWEKIHTGLVFWVGDPEEQQWLKEIGRKWAGITLDKLCFLPSPNKEILTDAITYVTGEDLSFSGRIVNEELLRIMETPYDLLLDLTDQSNPLIDYILKGSRAKCKIGVPKENFEADVMIDGVSGPLDLIDKAAVVFSGLKEA
ncbi:MAG: hypothetical protein LBR65_08450 [Culturomica sp.]|jgi:hypothetical protein|nr:hypothetical protein [Culturomica sp.]